MALNFGDHEDVVFAGAPLTSVLCQVKFPPILSVAAPAGVAGFQEAMRAEYPRLLDVEQSASFQVSPEPSMSLSAPVWKFTDEDAAWTVSLSIDFVSLDTPTYSSIDEFLSRLDRVLSALHRTLRPASSTRVGIRKINHFVSDTRNTASLLGIIRPELLGPLATESFPAPISGAGSFLQFHEDESTIFVVRTGLDTDEEHPLIFVLDMDYFTERPFEIDGGDALSTSIRHFSDGMTSFFHWAVEADYKKTLSPHPRASKES